MMLALLVVRWLPSVPAIDRRALICYATYNVWNEGENLLSKLLIDLTVKLLALFSSTGLWPESLI